VFFTGFLEAEHGVSGNFNQGLKMENISTSWGMKFS